MHKNLLKYPGNSFEKIQASGGGGQEGQENRTSWKCQLLWCWIFFSCFYPQLDRSGVIHPIITDWSSNKKIYSEESRIYIIMKQDYVQVVVVVVFYRTRYSSIRKLVFVFHFSNSVLGVRSVPVYSNCGFPINQPRSRPRPQLAAAVGCGSMSASCSSALAP